MSTTVAAINDVVPARALHGATPGAPEAIPWSRPVVAVVLTWRGRVGLFKRSAAVAHDAGQWHCITGFLDDDSSPLEQATRELWEETGLGISQLTSIEPRGDVVLAGSDGQRWVVHIFSASTPQRRLVLNWEHEDYRWVLPTRLSRFDGKVTWFGEVLRTTS